MVSEEIICGRFDGIVGFGIGDREGREEREIEGVEKAPGAPFILR
jgi:hypothetical protein